MNKVVWRKLRFSFDSLLVIKKKNSGRERCDQAPCCEEEPPTQQIFPLEDSVFLQARRQIWTRHIIEPY